MSGNRIINTGGGNYNESIQGDYIQGNSINIQSSDINITQDLSQTEYQIQQLLNKLHSQGYSQQDAQQKVASDLATKAKNDPVVKNKLVKFGQYISDAAANGLIGEAAVVVIKMALALTRVTI
ncbi:MAG: hypothetical protein VKL59_05930 [Nostocaceae cyanobacterium]|nr:hypothetical protein [Nostocaceae cyanobacterium]